MAVLRVALPKGHLWEGVQSILNQAGYGLRLKDARSYSVSSNDPELEICVHRAQNISPLVEEGKYDLGVTGLDMVVEFSADVEELLDLKFGKVAVVVAVPQRFELAEGEGVFESLLDKLRQQGKERVIVASEYENITRRVCEEKLGGFPFRFIRSYGATETFIGVADMIVDCTETGRSLKENGWMIMHKLLESTARVIANRRSLQDPWKRGKIEGFLELVRGAMEARGLKLLKMNVPEGRLNDVLALLPSMKSPTISKLAMNKEPGYAVEVAIKEDQVVHLIPALKKSGATDILEIEIKKAIK